MRCAYFEKECIGESPCIKCMTDEIYYLRKKIAGMESKNNVKEDSIMITRDELIQAQAEAFTDMVVKNPFTLLISDELSESAALTVKILFNKEEK